MREHGYLFFMLAKNDARARRIVTGCRRRLVPDDRVVIAHRYSTRPRPGPYEVHLNPREFSARSDYGCFVLDWESRDHQFAMGVEVDRWLDGGLNVLVQGGAGALRAAEERYGRYLRPVLSSRRELGGWANRLFADFNGRPAFRQLGLVFEEQPEPHPNLGALKLEGELEDCAEQLMNWLREEQPPLMSALRYESTLSSNSTKASPSVSS